MSLAPRWHPAAATAVPVLCREDAQYAATVFSRMAEERGASRVQARKIALAVAELANDIAHQVGRGHIEARFCGGRLELMAHDAATGRRSHDAVGSEFSLAMARRLLDGLEVYDVERGGLWARGWCVLSDAVPAPAA